MVLTSFPNTPYSHISFDTFQELLGSRNMVVFASHDHLHTHFENVPLTIKTTLKGQEHYLIDGEDHAVDSDTLLVIDRGRSYDSVIESPFPIDSFSIFFKDGMEEIVKQAVDRYEKSSLPHHLSERFQSRSNMMMVERLVAKRGKINHTLERIKGMIRGGFTDPMKMDELFYELLEGLHQAERHIKDRVSGISCMRKSTRIDIFNRLTAAQNFIHAHFSRDLSLGDLADKACMSEYHFLRMFKSFFSTTPSRYLIERRILKAKEYLKETDLPVKQICRRVGYSSESSFTRLFRRQTDMTPTAYRSN